jgi:hypothetical protein
MKKIFLILIAIFTISCEDVVDIPLETAEPRLVVEADILWKKGTIGNDQQIKLTLTTGFYETVIPPANGATVQLITSNNDFYNFIEDGNSGIYKCNDFEPIIGETYTLNIVYQGQIYRATEKLLPTPTIEFVEQEIVNGFGGDVTQLTFFYQDNPNETNYYLQKVESNVLTRPDLFANRDEFFNGNLMFEVFRNGDLVTGSIVKFTLISITERDFTFMRQFTALAGVGGGSPFNPPSGILRGNVKNVTNENKFPLGYFRLSELDDETYVVE